MEHKVEGAESSMNSQFKAYIYYSRFASCRYGSSSFHFRFPSLFLFPVLIGFKDQASKIICDFNPAEQS